MNRTTRTAVKIFIIAAATVACIALAYYLGANVTGHKLATASDNMNYSRWLEKYFALTRAAGLANGLCALGWFLAARFFFTVDEAADAGKRIFWAALMAASLAISLGVAHFYAPILGIKLNGIIFGLFAAIFTGAGYWLLTIFTTPLAFKYTPLGAQLILSRTHKVD
ncbi:MAG: hypothetical protein IKN16_06665 [Selenomonadaceae bacterium]|nr:hypothetical protein [Selenomonadaceae bacterium]